MKPSKKQTELAERILKTEDKNVLNYIEAILNNSSTQWEDELPDEIRKSLEQGIADADAGRVIPHAEVRKMYSTWLKR